MLALLTRIGGALAVFVGSIFLYISLFYYWDKVWAIVAIVLYPITVVIAPWYLAFTHEVWAPLAIIYAGLFLLVLSRFFGASNKSV